MNSDQFCYWLQGFFEMTDAEELTPDQIKMIKEHLQLVFTKVTSSKSKKTIQEKLDELSPEEIKDLCCCSPLPDSQIKYC